MSEKQAAASGGISRYNGVTIVTGGSMGIGEGIVRVFVKHGAKVVFCSNEDVCGPKLEAELKSDNNVLGEACFYRCDMTKEDDIKGMIDFTINKHGRIDCLVNNVGWHPRFVPIDEFTSDEFRDLFNLNVMSCFLASKYSLPHLRKVSGCIINNASMVAHLGQKHSVTYCATKGAIISLSRALAIDEAVHNVRVNSFSISNVMTPLWRERADQLPQSERAGEVQAGKDAQVLGRFGRVEEVGSGVLYLARGATFCTGIDLKLSGGCELDYGKKTQLQNN